MKKLSLFGAIALVLGLSACTKTQEPQSGELVKVTFNVSSLDVNVEPMTKSSVNASDGLTRIDYMFIGNSGTKSGTQTIAANPDDFGTIELWLSPGTYTAQIAGFAGNDGMIEKSGSDYYIYADNTDTFFYKQSLTIDTGNSYNIQLERLTGQLIIDITDESVSNEIKGYSVGFSPYNNYYIKNGLSMSSSRLTKTINVQDGAFPDFTYFMFQPPVDNVTELTISLIASDNSVLGQTIVGYKIYQNKKTIIRGNILDVITQKGLTITYNDEWGTDVIVPLQ